MRLPYAWSIVAAAALLGAAVGSVAAGHTELPNDTTDRLPSPDALSLAAIDPSVDACGDFYRHACGGFIAAAKLAPGRPVVRMPAQQFDQNLDRGLKTLFAQKIPDDPELHRLKTFFASCEAPDPSGTLSVRAWLRKIEEAKNRPQIQRLFRELSVIAVDPFVTYDGQPDRTEWTRYRGELRPSRLWAEPMVVERTFVLAGLTEVAARRDASFVSAIVAALRDLRVDRYDSKAAENPFTAAQIYARAPAMEMRRYLALVGAPADKPINVTSPAYLDAVNSMLAKRPLSELRAYLRWSFLFSLRGELPAPYNQAFGDIVPALRVHLDDPSSRCRDATVRAMGVEFSRQYSEHILGEATRDAATAMAKDIKRQVVASIVEADWLSVESRRATAEKLSKTDLKIGFPDRWPVVGNYPLVRDHFLNNVLAARRYEQLRGWQRVGRTRSRSDWEMIVSPWVGDGMAAARLVVPNGYPDAFSNSLIMTAAFLAKPRFDAAAAPEVNYATFGAIFAHEFIHVAETHMYDATGRPGELWTDADIDAAKGRDQCVIDQADAYEPLPGLKMSGEKQFGENVADYGGLRMAFAALEARMGSRTYQADGSGTSPAQRFFYAYARNYCTAQTEADLRQGVATDGHAPASFRVNGPLSNLPAFGRAFNCKPGAAMVRSADRVCRVW